MDSVEAGLVQDFIDESAECLLIAERCLVALESTEDQQGEIQELFRILHSIKGNAALFGCEAMKLVAHDAEHLLDHLRQQPEILHASMIDVLLESLDFFNQALDELRLGNQWSPEDPTVADLRKQLTALLHSAREQGDPLVLAADQLKELVKLAQDSSPELANRLYVVHRQLDKLANPSGVSESGPLGRLRVMLNDPIEDVLADDDCVQLENILSEMTDGAADSEAKRIAAEANEGYEVFSQSVGVDEALRQYLLERIELAQNQGQWTWQREATQRFKKARSRTNQVRETGRLQIDCG